MRASPPVRRRKRRKSKKCTSRNSGTPVRRTRRRKSKKMHLQEFWGSCAQNKTSEISKTCTFRNSSNQNKLRCLGRHLFWWGTPPGNYVLSQNHPKSIPEPSSGPPWAPSCSSKPTKKLTLRLHLFPCVYCYVPA